VREDRFVNAALSEAVVRLSCEGAAVEGAMALASAERNAVWEWLGSEHPALAKRLLALDGPAAYLYLDEIPPGSKRFLWEVLKRWRPATAALLTDDETVRLLRATFGASVGLPGEEILTAVGHEIGVVPAEAS
jgi:hypothetical protein